MSTQRVGSYEIVRMLARGGMAVVYLVRQPALDREVVLKRLDLERDDPTLAQRFVREARLAAALDHPNIVTLFDFFEHDGVPYIAMEYVNGGSLRSLVGTLDLPQVLGVLEGALAGLAHAERRGIAHRDLKPENVLVTRRGNVKIADFGIARAYNALSQRLTVTGKAMGTPVYMAPEQAMDEAIGPQTDLYALGVIVYELLTGRPPFESDSPMGVLYCHVHKPPPPLPHSLPPAVREWVGRLLEKAPADRPPSAGAAWQALEEIAVSELGPYWRRAAAITIPTGGHDAPRDEDEDDTTDEATAPAARADASRSRRRRSRRGGGGCSRRRWARSPCSRSPRSGSPPRSATTSRRRRTRPPRTAGGRALRLRRRRPARARGLRAAREPARLARAERRRDAAAAATAGTSSPRRTPGCRAGRAAPTSSAPGSPAATSTATAPPTSRSGRPDATASSVLFGTGHGLAGGRPDAAARVATLRLRPRRTRHGRGRLRRPARRRARGGRGARQRALPPRRAGRLERPPRADPRAAGVGASVGFGTRLRLGDVDGDHHVDLVEGGPPRPPRPGHATFCRGSSSGPRRCRAFGGTDGTSGLAVGDVNHDGYADIVQGDAEARPAAGAGVVRLWLGSRRGPRPTPILIDPGHARDPREERAGRPVRDGRGGRRPRPGRLRRHDRRGDGRERRSAGRITVIRGASVRLRERRQHLVRPELRRRCPARRRAGVGFGSTLAVLSLTVRPAAGPRGGGARRATRRLARDGGGERPRRVRARRDAARRRCPARRRACACRGAAGSGWRALSAG